MDRPRMTEPDIKALIKKAWNSRPPESEEDPQFMVVSPVSFRIIQEVIAAGELVAECRTAGW